MCTATATKSATPGWGFLTPPPDDDLTRAMYQADQEGLGFVMNLTRLWAQLPDAMDAYGHLVRLAAQTAGLTMRQRSILISACASSVGDSYCSLVWGAKLASFTDSRVAASVLIGDDAGLDPDEQVLARWARWVSTGPSDTTAQHVEELRASGRTDRQIFALTLFVAMRAAFACVNDALGAQPDGLVAATAPPAVREAVTYGRPSGSFAVTCA
jgi:alkylhydroperoxidase family enzyme